MFIFANLKIVYSAFTALQGGESETGIRLKVGEKVTLTHNFRDFADAADGPLKLGDVGTIITDDQSGLPFRVKAENGNTHWYKEGALRKAFPTQITISGAGHSRTNGVYRHSGDNNGRPYWQKVEGAGRIYYKSSDHGWVTNEDSDFRYWDYIGGESALPPEGTWPKWEKSEPSEPSSRTEDPRPTFAFGDSQSAATIATPTGTTSVTVTGAGNETFNGTYVRDANSGNWKKESGEYFKSVYDSDWGWVLSDSLDIYHYHSDPNAPEDTSTPPASATVSWSCWMGRGNGTPPSVVVNHAQHKKHYAHRHTLKANQSGGWNCDVCGRSGLGRSDERWRCTEGCDWDCCGQCIAKKKHSAHSHTLKANQSGGWNCDVCGRSGLDRSDERWRCAEGCDWDCCSRCIV